MKLEMKFLAKLTLKEEFENIELNSVCKAKSLMLRNQQGKSVQGLTQLIAKRNRRNFF